MHRRLCVCFNSIQANDLMMIENGKFSFEFNVSNVLSILLMAGISFSYWNEETRNFAAHVVAVHRRITVFTSMKYVDHVLNWTRQRHKQLSKKNVNFSFIFSDIFLLNCYLAMAEIHAFDHWNSVFRPRTYEWTVLPCHVMCPIMTRIEYE